MNDNIFKLLVLALLLASILVLNNKSDRNTGRYIAWDQRGRVIDTQTGTIYQADGDSRSLSLVQISEPITPVVFKK